METDIIAEANRLVPVSVDGKTEYVPMYVLLMRKMMHAGLKEDIRALKMSFDMIQRAQNCRELTRRHFYDVLKTVEEIANQAPLDVLETRTPEVINALRKWSRKV